MRGSGILMHITSLPGAFGVGTMGKHAYAFVDFLKKAGQSYWQILPLTPTGYGDSPYQSCSAFAGNHYLIDLEQLVEDGLLRQQEIDSVQWCSEDSRVDFGLQYDNRLRVLRFAYQRFTDEGAFEAFCRENSSWLADFSLFMALKDREKGAPWYRWEEDIKFRKADAIWQTRRELQGEIRFYSFVQYVFYKQWKALKTYANDAGIAVIGDVPIYVPLDSVEVWSDPELFCLDASLTPESVAGCPPDAFSEDGQLWGNPLYRWDVMAQRKYGWWLRRLAAAGGLYDIVRLDHFRGFEAYWSVPYGQATARNGHWYKGPGMDFINAIKKALPDLKLIAEDLGFLTKDVLDLRDASGYPGMKVLQFAFDSREPSDYLPHTYIANSICYTGTHDNMTTRQWFDTAPNDAVAYACEYMHLTEKEGFVWGAIRTAYSSVSDICIVPMQDYLDLGAAARMNFPGTQTGDNWTWRAPEGCCTAALAEKIRKLARLYGRLGNQKS